MSVSITFNQDLVALNSTQSPPSSLSIHIISSFFYMPHINHISLITLADCEWKSVLFFRIGGGNGIGNENENENVCSSMDFCLIINRQQKYK